MEVTGDAQILSKYNTYEKTHPVRLRGGKLTFRDNAVLTAPPISGGTRHIFSDGVTVFSGSSKISNTSQDYIDVVPILPNGNAKLVFTDRAGLEGTKNFDTLNIGTSSSDYSGTSTIEFLSDCNHKRIYGGRIGCPAGTGTMLIGAGVVNFNGRGIGIGSSNVGRYLSSTLSGGIGYITVTGGVLKVTSGGIAEGQLTGLRFGDGSAVPDSIAENYTLWEGYYTQSGGKVTNSGNLCVGNQRSKGSFVQTGGTFCNSASEYPFFVGVRGGTGSAVFSGGTTDIMGDVYVGGIFTNAIPHYPDTKYSLAAYGWENLAHYGTGKFTVSGGNVTLGKNLNLGYDGTGIVERVGSEGSFTVGGDLVMSNTAAFASASILRFALDSGGIAPIQIGGTATLTEGSSVNVDITAYTGKRATHTLLAATSVNGTFSDVDITCGGKTAGYARIIVLSDKVILKIQKETIVTFR